jgi:hypothetical protein
MKTHKKIEINRTRDLNEIEELLELEKAEVVILQSASRGDNLNTLYLGQKLMEKGFPNRKIRIHKENLFKITLTKPDTTTIRMIKRLQPAENKRNQKTRCKIIAR